MGCKFTKNTDQVQHAHKENNYEETKYDIHEETKHQSLNVRKDTDQYVSENEQHSSNNIEHHQIQQLKKTMNVQIFSHDYKQYFNLNQCGNDNFVSVLQKLKDCMNHIKHIIVVTIKAQSEEDMKEWLIHMHHELFNQFISLQLKPVLNEPNFGKLVKEFNQAYSLIVNDICVDTDIKHLQLDKNIILHNNHHNKVICSTNMKTQLLPIKMSWHNINDDNNEEYNND
eukprot:167228_1